MNDLKKISDILVSAGGIGYLVGGTVRDQFLGKSSKDIDIVVTGIPYEDLAVLLQQVGFNPKLVGKSFGVLKCRKDNVEYDFSLPRKERSTGVKHTDFEVAVDHTYSIKEDLSRRDFTINAIAQDLRDGTIVDPFGGQKDLENRLIRAVGSPSARFTEDPLRMLRGLGFAARFDFKIEESTWSALNPPTIRTVAGERVLIEMEKVWKQASHTKTFNRLMQTSQFGQWLFGIWNPMSIDLEKAKDRLFSGFISTFLNGGKFQVLNPKKEYQVGLEFARQVIMKDVPDFVGKKKEILLKVWQFYSVAYPWADKCLDFLTQPTHPGELALCGEDFQKLGIEGSDIGMYQDILLRHVWEGDLLNEKEVLASHLEKLVKP
jgi:tRNA nucleotidyltransferase/poly(A) polymerase